MDLEFYIDLEDSAGNRLGPGPITTAEYWESTGRMDRAGSFEFAMPASDPLAALLVEKAKVRAFAHLGGVWVEIGDGIIDEIETEPAADGSVRLRVSGQDGIYELNNGNMGFAAHVSGSGPVPANPNVFLPAAIYNVFYDGSEFDGDASALTTNPDIYGQFGGESCLQGLIMSMAMAGYHWRYQSAGKVIYLWDTIWEDSGVRAVHITDGDLSAETCGIESLKRTVETHDLYTRIYPFGAGQGRARLSLQTSTRSAPTGYTISLAAPELSGNYIQHTAAHAQYGRIDRWVEFKGITALSNSDADLQAAANALFDAAKLELDRHRQRFTHYELSVVECSRLLRPGQTIRVDYRDPEAGLVANQALNILEATIRVDSDGVRTTRLTVTDGDRWPIDDNEIMASRMAEGRVFQAHPQINANSYVTSYNKNIDALNNAFFRFRFGNEVTTLNQVLFEFQLLPFESTVRTVGGATSGSGAINTTTVSLSAGTTALTATGTTSLSTATTGLSTATTNINTATTNINTATTNLNTATTNLNTATTSLSTNTAALDTDGPSVDSTGPPEGGDTIGVSGRHSHLMGVGAYTGSGGHVVYLIPSGTNSQFQADGATGSVAINVSGDHTHDIGDHTHDLGDHSHPIASHSHTIGDHSHTIGSHSHTIGSHSHTIGSHSHAIGDHSHAIGSHSHAIGDHSHTIADHNHSLAESLTAIYGVFREAQINTYSVFELEYRVNGGSWTSLTGADNVGDGWRRLNITAAVTNLLRPVQENNLLEIRVADSEWKTIDSIFMTGTTLNLDTTPPPAGVGEIGKQLAIRGTTNYNGMYTITDIVFVGGPPGTPVGYQCQNVNISAGSESSGEATISLTVNIDAQLSVRNTIQAISYG